jgi:hypothetical protein
MFPKRSGAMNSIAVVSPTRVPITNQTAEVMQKPLAVLWICGKAFVVVAI